MCPTPACVGKHNTSIDSTIKRCSSVPHKRQCSSTPFEVCSPVRYKQVFLRPTRNYSIIYLSTEEKTRKQRWLQAFKKRHPTSIHWQWHWTTCFSRIVFYICPSVSRFVTGKLYRKITHYCVLSLIKSVHLQPLVGKRHLLSWVKNLCRSWWDSLCLWTEGRRHLQSWVKNLCRSWCDSLYLWTEGRRHLQSWVKHFCRSWWDSLCLWTEGRRHLQSWVKISVGHGGIHYTFGQRAEDIYRAGLKNSVGHDGIHYIFGQRAEDIYRAGTKISVGHDGLHYTLAQRAENM